MRLFLRAAIVAALIAALPGTAAGQARRWADPYRQGRDAVKAGRYEEGIPLLLQAIKVASRQERIKIVEGVDQTEYFPYYYLGLAYLRTKQLDAAEQAFTTAKQCRCLTADLADLLRVYEADLTKLKTSPAPSTPTAPPPPTGPSPEFQKQLTQAEAAAASGRHADAVRIYDALRSMDAAEYAKRNLGAKRADSERARATDLARQGDQLASAGQLNDARARYQEAESLAPGTGRAGLDDVQRRQSEYARLKGAAEADARAGRDAAAREKARQAGLADPEQFRADNLLSALDKLRGAATPPANVGAEKARELVKRAQSQVSARNYREAASLFKQALGLDPKNAEASAWLDANTQFEELRDRGRQLHSEGKLQEAMQTLDDARRRDGDRFTAEGLDALVKRIADEIGHLPEEQIAPVRAALISYLQGDVAKAAAALEPLAARPSLDPRARAHVHAYLGAAYGDLALSARSDAERTDLRRKALEQFRQLIAVQPEYRMSEMLISPRIRELLAEARKR